MLCNWRLAVQVPVQKKGATWGRALLHPYGLLNLEQVEA
jgi:hypothetical protein